MQNTHTTANAKPKVMGTHSTHTGAVRHAKFVPDRCDEANQQDVNRILTGTVRWRGSESKEQIKGPKEVWNTRVPGVAPTQ